MIAENLSGNSDQQDFDIERHKREIEKRLGKKFEVATSTELIKAEIKRLVEEPDGSIDLKISEDEAARLSHILQDKKSESRKKIYEWGEKHGIIQEDNESDLSYLLRVWQAKSKVKNQKGNLKKSTSEDQESLF